MRRWLWLFPLLLGAAPSSPTALWLLAEPHFAQVAQDPRVAALFREGWVLEPVGPKEHPTPGFPILPVAVFHSEALFQRALAQGELKGVRVVLYDNGLFPNTPPDEQAHPLRFDQRFTELARSHGLLSMCDFILPSRRSLGDRVPQKEVPPCSLIGLNTVQQSERDPARYARVVAADVAVIRSLRPRVPILAGISSNPRGEAVTPGELRQDFLLVAHEVQGYWLNVPAPGIGCPRCLPPNPSILAAALAGLPPEFHTAPLENAALLSDLAPR